MTTALALHEAIAAAHEFIRWGNYHQDRPRPERVEQARLKAIEELVKLGEVK